MADQPTSRPDWPDVRTGFGVDVHAFGGPGPVVLAGVAIEHPAGLAGHSDADCVLHAVADAVLGAAALGDLGDHFPDSDPAFAGADSAVLLAEVVAMVAERGWTILNVDATVVAQAPRVSPHRDRMRANLARACAIEVGRVSVKATTTDGLGLTGRGEGIAALAVVTVAGRRGRPAGGR